MIRNLIYTSLMCCVLAIAVLPVTGQDGFARTRRVAAGGRATEMQIFDLVNRQRARSNASSLAWNEDIAGVARAYSERMAREDFFGHYDPEGHTAIERASKVRGWSYIGENLFVSEDVADLAAFAIHGWIGSETHRTNMLDPQWTSTGIGLARAANGDIYVTELFTRR